MAKILGLLALIVSLALGLSGFANSVLFGVKKAAVEKVHKGLPSLSSFTKKMTGTKSDLFNKKLNINR